MRRNSEFYRDSIKKAYLQCGQVEVRWVNGDGLMRYKPYSLDYNMCYWLIHDMFCVWVDMDNFQKFGSQIVEFMKFNGCQSNLWITICIKEVDYEQNDGKMWRKSQKKNKQK